MRFGKRGKLSPRYIEPYEIVSKVGPVAYKLKLPLELSIIHDTFHVSMLRKYISDPSHVLREQSVRAAKGEHDLRGNTYADCRSRGTGAKE